MTEQQAAEMLLLLQQIRGYLDAFLQVAIYGAALAGASILHAFVVKGGLRRAN